MVTKEEALIGAEFEHVSLKNRDKTPVRCRRNGKTKTWKTRPEEFSVPVKRGLKDCFYITESNAKDWVMVRVDPFIVRERRAEEVGLPPDTPPGVVNDLRKEKGLDEM